MKKIMLAVLCAISSSSFASSDGPDYVTYTFENDTFFQEDGGYTNGLMGNWGYDNLLSLDDESIPGVVSYLAKKRFSDPDYSSRSYSVDYSIGQFIQTPNSIKVPELAVEDAPYAGLLAFNVGVYASNNYTYDGFNLTLGFVGPISGAKQVQKTIHDLIGANEPLGWDNQLKNEPVFRLETERVWRSYSQNLNDFEFDIITGLKGGFGNLSSDVTAGVGFRLGKNLESSFKSSTPFTIKKMDSIKGSSYGWYVFANASGSIVGNDIFIDGNSFTDSHSVDIEHFQSGVTVGASVTLYNWSLLYSLTSSTDEYKTQTEKSRFGRLSVNFRF